MKIRLAMIENKIKEIIKKTEKDLTDKRLTYIGRIYLDGYLDSLYNILKIIQDERINNENNSD